MDRDIHYKEFWQMIRSKILTMRELDSNLELLPQAKVHRYGIAPVVPVRTIVDFERRNKLELPPSYRSYLQFFGAKGASAFSSTYHFELDIFQRTVQGSSSYIPFEGQREITVEEYESRDFRPQQIAGTVHIAHGWNPVSPDLVINGVGRGYVFWNSGDFIGCEGEFWQWYLDWTDKALIAINQRLILKHLPRFTKITDVQSLFPIERFTFMERYNHNCVIIKHDVPTETVESGFILNTNGTILESFRSRSALWEFCENNFREIQIHKTPPI